MSQYDQDIINQALGFLKEDNKRFVKIVTAKKNVVAAESDIKIISDNKFYPVQYWLDTVTDPKHIEVLKELNYSSDSFLDWWDQKFGLFISSRPALAEVFNKSDWRLGSKSLREFGKELVEKTDSEPFYNTDQRDAVELMSFLLDKIYLSIAASPTSRSSETPEGTTTTETGDSSIPPVSSDLAPPVADVTTMEPVEEVDGFIKGKETLIKVCTEKMQSLKPSDKIIFYGSEKFNFMAWWTSLPNRYKGTDIVKILGKPVQLYAESLDPEKQGAYVPAEINKTKITNPDEDPRLKSGTAPADPTTPATEISASFLISKFIKIAQEPEKSFDEIFDGVLDDYLKSSFGDPPKKEDDGKDVVEDESEEAPKKKTNIFKSLKEILQRKPEEYVAIQSSGLATSTMKLYEFPFESRLKDNLFYDPEQQDVIVNGIDFTKLINQLLNAILAFENNKKKQQVDSANNIAEQLQKTMDLTSAFYKGLGGSNLPTYTPRSRGKF